MVNQEWPTLLGSMSIDSLRFEKLKRLSELEYLEDRMSRMQYQEGRSNDEWEQSFEKASAQKAMGRHFNASGYETEIDLTTKKSRLESRIIELKQEIQAIEKALESKLRS